VFTKIECLLSKATYMRDRSYGATRKEDALVDSQLQVLMWFLTVSFVPWSVKHSNSYYGNRRKQ